MAHLGVSNIHLAFGERRILCGVGFTLQKGSKIALVGGNGSGKTTLLKIIARQKSPDDGSIALPRGLRISYLPQEDAVLEGHQLLDEVELAFSHIHQLISEKERLELTLNDAQSHKGKLESILEEHYRLTETIEESGYHTRRSRIELILQGLGFSPSDFSRRCGEFSGGWRMRIALAKILLENPDFLLLDEPTNYLDIEAREWLEGYLRSFSGGVLLVSHDRQLLDGTVSGILELFGGTLRKYRGNYSDYVKTREVEMINLLKRYQEQQREIARVEQFINRFRAKESKAVQVQSRIKQLEKIERIEIPDSIKPVHFSLPAPPHSGRRVLVVDGVSKSYGVHQVLSGVELELERGERLLISGVNGAGKSTLMRILARVEEPTEGGVKYGEGVKVGYFSQELHAVLQGGCSVLEEIESAAPTTSFPTLRNHLGAFLFQGDDIYKPVEVLSGGEKSRLALLKMLLHPVNLLILDEPTNHLDLTSKAILMEALAAYPGTLVFVSHDRYFAGKIATNVLELRHGNYKLYPGDYAYYRWCLDRVQVGEEATPPVQNQSILPTDETSSSGRVRREREQERKSTLRRLARREAEILRELEINEQRRCYLEGELARPANYTDGESSKKIQQEIAGLLSQEEELTRSWEEVTGKLDSLEQS